MTNLEKMMIGAIIIFMLLALFAIIKTLVLIFGWYLLLLPIILAFCWLVGSTIIKLLDKIK